MVLVFIGLALAQSRQATPGSEGDGHLVVVGESVGPATVERVELHREFERVHLSAPGQTLPPVELVREGPDRRGICSAHGWTLFPRWELVGEVPTDPWHLGERPPESVEEQVHAALCQRMEARGAQIELSRNPGAPPQRADPLLPDRVAEAVPLGWAAPLPWLIAGLGLLLAGLGLRRLDRSGGRDLALVLGASALTRALLSPAEAFNGAMASYEKLAMALNLKGTPTLYGQGWRALLAPAVEQLGAQPATVFEAHRLLAILSPLLLWAALRATLGPRPALLGGLALALHAGHIRLAATEEMAIPTLFLALVGAAAATQAGRGGAGLLAGALAGLAAGFAAHVRPEGLLVLPAIAALPLALRGRAALRDGGPWLALLLGGLLVLLRLADLPPAGDSAIDPARFTDPGFLLRIALPSVGPAHSPHHLAFDLVWTSPLLPLLALLGLLRPRLAAPWALWVLGTGFLLAKSWPQADALRLQLLAAPGWIGLAALGLARPLERRPLLLVPVVGLLALPLSWMTQPWARFDLARHQEWRWLAQVVPALPEGSVLRLESRLGRSAGMAQVLEAMAPQARVFSAERLPAAEGQLVLIGLSCFEGEPGEALDGCAELRGGCQGEELAGAWVQARTDLDTTIDPRWLDNGRLRLSLERLVHCPEGSGLLSPEGSGLLSPEGSGLLSPEGSGLLSPEGGGVSGPEGGGLLNPDME